MLKSTKEDVFVQQFKEFIKDVDTNVPDSTNQKDTSSGVSAHLKQVLLNYLIIIPIYIVAIIAAVFSSIITSKLDNFKDNNVSSAFWWSLALTIIIWLIIVFVGLPFIIFIPFVAGFSQYIYTAFLIIIIIIFLGIAVFMFYVTATVFGSEDFSNREGYAVDAFRDSILVGILLILAAIGLGLYAWWSTKSYINRGGFTGDVAAQFKAAAKLGKPVAVVAAPEALPLFEAFDKAGNVIGKK